MTIFEKNQALSVFSYYECLSSCKKSEKSDEPIPRKVGNRRTDGRTQGQA